MVSIALLASINILGGLIFGYNTGIVAAALPLIGKVFTNVGDSTYLQGVFSASILFGAMMGSLGGGPYCDRLGRKITIITLGVFATVGPIATALSPTLVIMLISRVVCGVGVGLATAVCPTYVSENAPPEKKGTLGTFFQLAITFGIFLSYLVGLLKNIDKIYRLMFGLGAVPGGLILIAGLIMGESGPWLSRRVTERDPLLSRQIQSPRRHHGGVWDLFFGHARKSFAIGMLLAIAQQLTGINAVMYYAPSIFKSAGLENPIIPTIGVGLWNFITTFISTFLVDRLGRRPLLLAGTLAMALSTVVLAITFSFIHGTALAVLSIVFLLAFVAGFETGEGPLFWVVCIELFDDDVRGSALSFLNATTWIFNLILTFAFLPLLGVIGQGGVFWIFSGVGIVSVVLMYFVLPETKREQVLVDEYVYT